MVPRRPGPWRAISLLVVLATLVIVALSILQARDASDVAVSTQQQVSLEQATVTVSGLAAPSGSQVAVLGLPDAQSRIAFDAGGTSLDLPRDFPAVVSLTNATGDIIGLAAVALGADRSDVEVSPRSTAQALVLLTPGILRPNLEEAFAITEVVEVDPAFQVLVDAVAANSNISQANEGVEQSLAAIADRLPIREAAADQGCDSVVSRDAYASAGTCVQPGANGLTVSNEQDRWVLVFHDTPNGNEACGVVAPADEIGDDELIANTDCQGEARLAAPGPDADYREAQALVDRQVLIATGLTTLFDYTGPFADLTAASAGVSSQATTQIRQNFFSLAESFGALVDTDDDFSAALAVPRAATTARQRHLAALSATEIMIRESDRALFLPQRVAADSGHVGLVEFLVRAGERMTSDRTDWRWVANASDTLEFGAPG